MNRRVLVIVLIGLFLLPALYSPENLCPSSDGPAIGNESQVIEDFVISADGDESSESITSFSETTDDDVLFYPDAFLNDTAVVASSGTSNNTGGGTYLSTQVKDGVYWYAAGPTYMTLNFSIPSDIEYFEFAGYLTTSAYETASLQVYDWTNNIWVEYDTISEDGNYVWKNYTLYDPDYFSTVQIAFNLTIAVGGVAGIDYFQVLTYYMTLADADH